MMGSGTSNSPTDCSPDNGDGQTRRATWSHPVEFLLSCIGFTVGLSNVWRFPYLCMRNGGGSFLIPYFVCLFFCGIPLFFMEIAIGQYSSCGPLSVWKMCPIFQGLGWGMVIATSTCAMYYNVIIAWVLYYLGMSLMTLSKQLPWADCGHIWNTDHCLNRGDIGKNETGLGGNNTKFVTPEEEFWEHNVLQRSPGVGELGGFRWELVATLAVAWLLIFMCLVKGIKSSGKVVYVTATVPYIFLTILLIRGLLLPGSAAGIRFYIMPNFKRLLQLKTWAEASMQVFYSLGSACGISLTIASYNKFNYNCQLHAFIVPLVNCGTSFFAGFVIFSIIGFMAHDAGVPVEEVISSGPGLVFMAYPEAIARMPLSPVWAVLFFLMLLTMGLDSQFSMFEVPLSAIFDSFAKLSHRKPLITGILCVLFFFINLICVTRAGVYYFQLIDWYCVMYSVPLIGFLECLSVTYIYGWRRLFNNIEEMTGRRPSKIWIVLWCFLTPVTLLGLILSSYVDMSEPSYGDYVYPRIAIAFGWVLTAITLLPLPICAVRQLLREKGALKQRFLRSLQAAPDWRPARERDIQAARKDSITNGHGKNNSSILLSEREPLSI